MTGRTAFVALACGVLTVAARPAVADEIELEPARFVFGDPGELFIECESPDGMLDVKEDPREFYDWNEYAEFLKTELNAIPEWEGDEVVHFDLATYASCETLYHAPGAMQPLKTDWPALVVLGGATGYVFIGDQARCVNPDLCNPEGQATRSLVQTDMTIAAMQAWEISADGSTRDTVAYRNSRYEQYLVWKTIAARQEAPYCCLWALGRCIRTCRDPSAPLPVNRITHQAAGFEGGDPMHPIYPRPYSGRTVGYTPCIAENSYNCTSSRTRWDGGHANPSQWFFGSTACAHEVIDRNVPWREETCTVDHQSVPCSF